MGIIAILMSIFIATATPLTYLYMNLHEETTEANYLAGEVSGKLINTVRLNPELWKYSVIKFMKVFDELEAKEIARIRIYDETDTLLESTEYDKSFRLTRTGSASIIYNNTNFGRVEIDKIADRTLASSLSLFLGFCLLGGTVGLILFLFPSRSIKSMENVIEDMIDRLDGEIAERVAKEKKLEEALHEGDTLLKEIHHRVKNNLQIVASLLGLRINRLDDGETKTLLQDIRSKIVTMARVHEQIYNSDSFSLIDMERYLFTVAEGNNDIRIEGAPTISYQVEAKGIELSLETAIPIGLMASELVTNCRKYAFQGRTEGKVEIRLEQMDSGRLRLSVADNGVGVSDPDGMGQRGKTLGQLLVRSLATQVSGKVRIESDGGLKVTIEDIKPI